LVIGDRAAPSFTIHHSPFTIHRVAVHLKESRTFNIVMAGMATKGKEKTSRGATCAHSPAPKKNEGLATKPQRHKMTAQTDHSSVV
jgi:hypothetical protein